MKWHEVTYPSVDSNLFNAGPYATVIYKPRRWFLRHVRKKIKHEKDSKTQNAGRIRKEIANVFIMFQCINVMFDSLVCTKCDIKKAWSHSGAHWWRSTGRSLLSQRWADYQLWNNSRLAQPAAQNSGQACAPAPRGSPVCSSDWMSWFLVVICFSRRQEATLFSCSLSTCFTAARLWRALQSDVLVSHRCSPLLGRPRVFHLWTLWHWEVRHSFKLPQHFSFHFFDKNSAPPARPELHLLPGNDSLLNILSGSIEINWERVSGSEA